jgi:2'-5' RNA ligase
MRLFAAVYPSAAALHSLEDAVARAVPDPSPGLRRTMPDQWHVTTAFFGDVPGDRVEQLSERLARAAARTTPFPLWCNGFSGFPTAGRARVVVATLAGDRPGLQRLAERCTAAGRRTGLAMDARRFRAHLTVARARTEPVDVRDRFDEHQGPAWDVAALRLVRSTLGSQVRHEILTEFALTGGAPGDQPTH